MLPRVRGITFCGEVIDLGNPLEIVLSHPNTRLLAQNANSAANRPRGVGRVGDIRSDHTFGPHLGHPEVWLELWPEARSPGLSPEERA